MKIQTYTPDTMTINSSKSDFQIKDGLWKGQNLYELYEKAHTPFEWHEELFDFSRRIGLTIFSTPFDETAVDLLESLGSPAYKIASFEIIDLPLIKYVAEKGKPMLLSTGMASKDEVSQAIEVINETGNSQVLLFHCVSSYPTPTEQSDLSNIKFLKNHFGVEVGLSDHTISNLASTIAIGMGAVAVEKHFKLDDTDCGPDSSFSLNPAQLKSFVDECNLAWKAVGEEEFSRSNVEEKNIIFRRSLYFVKNKLKGQKKKRMILEEFVLGMGSAKKFRYVLGKTLLKDVERGDPVKWEYFC